MLMKGKTNFLEFFVYSIEVKFGWIFRVFLTKHSILCGFVFKRIEIST